MAWIYLVVAGLFEICFAMGLKYTQGFTRLWPTLFTLASAGVSLWLMTQAMKTIPVGTAYAVWTGIGATGVAVVGMVLFSEPASLSRLICLGLIVVGVIGLKLVSAA